MRSKTEDGKELYHTRKQQTKSRQQGGKMNYRVQKIIGIVGGEKGRDMSGSTSRNNPPTIATAFWRKKRKAIP